MQKAPSQLLVLQIKVRFTFFDGVDPVNAIFEVLRVAGPPSLLVEVLREVTIKYLGDLMVEGRLKEVVCEAHEKALVCDVDAVSGVGAAGMDPTV